MDINDGVYEGIRYLWQILVASLSAAFSFVLYKHRKQNEQIEALDSAFQESHTLIRVFEERINNIMADIEEIKADIKKMLFKL